MARPLVRWLRFEGWTVYQEVVVERRDNRADIVAEKDDVTWIIEAKRTLSLDLLAQADAWRHYSPLISIAVPPVVRRSYRGTPGRDFAHRILKQLGIGIIHIHPPQDRRGIEIKEVLKPQRQSGFFETYNHRLREALVPQRENFAEAGNARGKFWSPFQETCGTLRQLVEEKPGISIHDAVAELGKMHYASENSARGSLTKRIEEGVVDGLRWERAGRKLILFLADPKCIDK